MSGTGRVSSMSFTFCLFPEEQRLLFAPRHGDSPICSLLVELNASPQRRSSDYLCQHLYANMFETHER